MPQFRRRLLNGAAGDETLAVGQQHDLEHDASVIGAGTDFVVLEPGVQRAEAWFSPAPKPRSGAGRDGVAAV